MIQCSLWVFAIYVVDMVLIADLVKGLLPQFLTFFIYVLHQLCLIRNLYRAMYTNSEVRPVSQEEIEGDIMGKKYNQCKKCNKYRPRRSHHCSICETCIDKMDHHCIILNTCIGRYNYRFFFSYVYLAMVNCIMIFAICLASLLKFRKAYYESYNKKEKLEILKALTTFPVRGCIVCFFAFIGMISSTYFFSYHCFLISKGETTIERKHPKLKEKDQPKKKGTFIEKLQKAIHSKNLFDIYWPDD